MILQLLIGSNSNQEHGYSVRCQEVRRALNKSKVRILAYVLATWKESESNSPRMNRILTFDPSNILQMQVESMANVFKLRRQIRNADLVVMEGMLTPLSFLTVKMMGAKIVLDTHGVNSAVALSLLRKKNPGHILRFIAWYMLEYWQVHFSDHVVAVSTFDLRKFKELFRLSSKKASIVPNVLPKEFQKERQEEVYDERISHILQQTEGRKKVAFVGNLDVLHNRRAATYILDHLAPSLSSEDIVFLIIGTGEKISHNSPNVILTGYVENLPYLLDNCDLCIAPLDVGTGTKTKILCYLSLGKPLLATDTAMEGIDIPPTDLITISDLHSFSHTLSRMMQDLERLASRSEEMIGYIHKYYSYSALRKSIEALIRKVNNS